MGKYQLREYQKTAVDDGLNFFANGNNNAISILPTGSGKSLVIAAMAKQLDSPTLIFQPRKEILEQNYEKLINYGESPQIYSASFNSKKIGYLTLATIGSVFTKPELFENFKYIIIDECHLVNSKKGMYKEFIEKTDARVLGLTATPYRLTTDGYGGSILKFITRTRPRVFNKVIHVTQNGYLFDQNYLAPLKYYVIGEFDSTKLKLNSTGADYTDRSVKSYYEDYGFVDKLQDIVERVLAAGRKNVLVFTRFIKESEALVEKLGSSAEIVTAKTPKKERTAIIKRFRSGETKVVSNVGVLSIGFDFPELETIILAKPTMSLALYYQMIGRGIRISPEKNHTWVIDLCDNYRKFGKVEDLKLVEPRPNLWHISSRGNQLTNIYYDDRKLT